MTEYNRGYFSQTGASFEVTKPSIFVCNGCGRRSKPCFCIPLDWAFFMHEYSELGKQELHWCRWCRDGLFELLTRNRGKGHVPKERTKRRGYPLECYEEIEAKTIVRSKYEPQSLEEEWDAGEPSREVCEVGERVE